MPVFSCVDIVEVLKRLTGQRRFLTFVFQPIGTRNELLLVVLGAQGEPGDYGTRQLPAPYCEKADGGKAWEKRGCEDDEEGEQAEWYGPFVNGLDAMQSGKLPRAAIVRKLEVRF